MHGDPKAIDPGSAFEWAGILYALMGLLMGIIFALVSMWVGLWCRLRSVVSERSLAQERSFFAIFYGIIGGICAAISAAVYNLVRDGWVTRGRYSTSLLCPWVSGPALGRSESPPPLRHRKH